MKVIFDAGVQKSQEIKNAFAAIGVFDGLHLGHQSLIRRAIRKAKRESGVSVVVTFDPHPVHVLHPEINCPLIVSLSHRIKLIERLGVDYCWVIHFTKAFSKLSPEEFIQDYLVKKINPVEVFLGDDFRFGKNRSGDLYLFREAARRFGFKVNILSAVKSELLPISSTLIRKFVIQGDLSSAERLLGRRISVFGKVVHGDSRGKTLGYPTANVDYGQELLPPSGVYLSQVLLGQKRLNAVTNVGRCPSFYSKLDSPRIEVHILDFSEDIYGQEMFVEFIKKLRDEIQFSTPRQLINQIQKDEQKARRYFLFKQ